MRFGIHIANFGDFHDPRAITDLARLAEDAGWDGFFLWDHILYAKARRPVLDPWIVLAAVAMRTERIRLSPLVTPLPRRRPWQVAREAVTLDHLSGGRLILGLAWVFRPSVSSNSSGRTATRRREPPGLTRV